MMAYRGQFALRQQRPLDTGRKACAKARSGSGTNWKPGPVALADLVVSRHSPATSRGWSIAAWSSSPA